MTHREELEEQSKELGRLIDIGLNHGTGQKKIGFALLIFDFGENGDLAYISNGRRENMIKAMQECIQKISN